jgi:ADP-ribose pyrophosphatase YjhB (NUDIX family)
MPSDSARHSVSVSAAVIRDGRILAIQRRDNQQWEPPGGVLELDETIEDGLRREVLEETGLDVEPERLTGVYKNMTRGIVALTFRCHVTGGELATSDETRDLAWLSPDDITALMSPAFAVRLLDALPESAPAVRAHDGTLLIASPTRRQTA